MARMRKSALSSGMTLRQLYQCCGKPCSSTSGGASSGPAWATCARTPVLRSCHRCSTPGRSGGSITGGGDHLLDPLALERLLGHERHAGVLVLELLVVADRPDGGVHAVHAHLERILGDQRVHGAVGHALDLVRRGVPADDLDLADLVGHPDRLDRAHVARLVGGEDALEVRVGGEDVLGHGERLVVVVLRVLRRDELELRMLLQALHEAVDALVVGLRAGVERHDRHLAALRPDRLGQRVGGQERATVARAVHSLSGAPVPGEVRRGNRADIVALMKRAAAALLVLLALAAPAQARERAPGAPGAKADWAAPAKRGFGTAVARSSRVWFTLRGTAATEVFYPDLAHPSARGIGVWVDGRPEAGTAQVAQADPAAPVYRQTVTAKRWRLTRTYVTD